MPNDPAASPHRTERGRAGRARVERALVSMAATVIGFSILAIVAVLVATAARVDLRTSVWPIIVTLPLIGFPIGVLLILALLIVSVVRRSRGAG